MIALQLNDEEHDQLTERMQILFDNLTSLQEYKRPLYEWCIIWQTLHETYKILELPDWLE